MHFFQIVSLIFIGFAGGIAVGGAFVAFLVVLDIIPRLAQISRSYAKLHWFEGSVVAGAVFWTSGDFYEWAFYLNPMGTAFVGCFAGIFVGMLAAALTEVLNVLPILAKRMHLSGYLIWFLMSMVMGKVAGSLFDWIIFRA
jgi:stage V sporulation protein AB